MVSDGSGGPSIGRGTFQTGSHEIWGSVAARTCRAVVTTSMFMIWSGIPLSAAETFRTAWAPSIAA